MCIVIIELKFEKFDYLKVCVILRTLKGNVSLLLDFCQQHLTLIDDLSQNISLCIFFYFF